MKPYLSAKNRPSPSCALPDRQLSLCWPWLQAAALGLLYPPYPGDFQLCSFPHGENPFNISGSRQGKS